MAVAPVRSIAGPRLPTVTEHMHHKFPEVKSDAEKFFPFFFPAAGSAYL
jgi:hypothetical protein